MTESHVDLKQYFVERLLRELRDTSNRYGLVAQPGSVWLRYADLSHQYVGTPVIYDRPEISAGLPLALLQIPQSDDFERSVGKVIATSLLWAYRKGPLSLGNAVVRLTDGDNYMIEHTIAAESSFCLGGPYRMFVMCENSMPTKLDDIVIID